MSIRNRLTLTFTVLIGSIIMVLGLAIYLLVADFTQRDFYDRLLDRAILAGQLKLEQDELSAASFAKLRQKSRQSLHRERIEIYEKKTKKWLTQPAAKAARLDKIFSELQPNQYANFILQDHQAAAYYYTDNEGDFYVLVGAQDLSGAKKLQYLQGVLIISFICSILLVILVARVVANQALNPIAAIVDQVNKIRATNLHLRLSEGPAKDEIANLSNTFNQMLDRLEHSFISQKNFISNASHELQNPLTAIAGEIEVTLTRDRSPEEYKASLGRLQNEAERLEKLTKSLFNLAQAEQLTDVGQVEAFRVDELIWEVMEQVKQKPACPPIWLEMDDLPEDPEKLVTTGNKTLLNTALKNILENACKFSDHQPVILRLKIKTENFKIIIRDKGIGIPAADLQNITEPFFRARNARGIPGTGIGLALSNRIIRQNGGTFKINSTEGQGTEVAITLPIKNA